MLYDSGLCVFPVPPREKKPRIQWKALETVRPTWEQTVTLYSEEEDATPPEKRSPDFLPNTAIICGAVSAGFFCVEYDEEAACIYTFCRFPELKLHETRVVLSGGKSTHLYFKSKPDADLKSLSYHKEGLPAEFRGNGNIIIAPPSIHPSGRPYIFKNRREITEKDPSDIKVALVLLAQEWKYVSKVIPKWVVGMRDQLTMGFSCFLRKKLGFDQDRVEKVITAICEFTKDEELSGRLVQVRREFTLGEDETSMQHMGEEVLGAITKLLPRKRGRPSGRKEEDPWEHPDAMAEEIMKTMKFVTAMDTEELYIYNDGLYHDYGGVKVKERVIQIDSEKGSRYADEVIFNIKAKTYKSRDLFNSNPSLIPLENGVFNVETMQTQESSPDLIYTIKIPVKYDAAADCPVFKKFISEVLRPSDILIIQELFGFCLLRDYRYQKSFLFVGDGANGKSTLLETLRRLLGRDNVSSIPLQELTTNRFATGQLYGKLANICADLPDKALSQTGIFKLLTGGDAIKAEHKHIGLFAFTNYAKLVFSCNKVPKAEGDDSTAFYRRQIILNFPNTFLSDKADKGLLFKLTTPNELSGILNWAIEGLKRLRTQDDFSFNKGVEEVREQYERLSDPLRAFVSDKIIMDENGAITKEDFYSAYVMYCKNSNLPMVTMTTIGRNLPQVIPTIRQGDKIMVGDKRKTAWRGIRLRGENETSEDTEPPKGDKTPPEPPKEMQLKLNIGDDRPENLKRFQTLNPSLLPPESPTVPDHHVVLRIIEDIPATSHGVSGIDDLKAKDVVGLPRGIAEELVRTGKALRVDVPEREGEKEK